MKDAMRKHAPAIALGTVLLASLAEFRRVDARFERIDARFERIDARLYAVRPEPCKASRTAPGPPSASRATRRLSPGPHDLGYAFERFARTPSPCSGASNPFSWRLTAPS